MCWTNKTGDCVWRMHLGTFMVVGGKKTPPILIFNSTSPKLVFAGRTAEDFLRG